MRKWSLALLLAVAALASALFLGKGTDLRVYWYGAHNFFTGQSSAYGPDSGINHPMEYRYPPVTYLIFYPLPYLPLRVVTFLWVLGEWAAAIATLYLAIRVRGLRFSRRAVLACCGAMLSYVVLAIRYDNVQPFVICAIFSALILAEDQPVWSGLLAALAVTFKVTPVMFLAWLLPRPRWRALTSTLLWLAALWLLPVAVFGIGGYHKLLAEWYAALRQVGTTYSEVYYVLGQSLAAVSLRYFSNIAEPGLISQAAQVIGIAAACFYIARMLRADRRTLWAWDGLAFILYSLIEPYGVKSGLISSGPAVLTAACLYSMAGDKQDRQIIMAKRLFLGYCLILFISAIAQHRPWIYFLQTIGIDFWAGLLLLASLTVWLTRTSVPNELGSAASGTDG